MQSDRDANVSTGHFGRESAESRPEQQSASGTGPFAIPRPTEPPTPITSKVTQPVPRRPVVFEEQEDELDVPDFLK